MSPLQHRWHGFLTAQRSYAVNMVRKKVPTHDVEDVAQEALIRALPVIPRGASQGEWMRLLQTITHRTIAEHYRQAHRHAEPAEIEDQPSPDYAAARDSLIDTARAIRLCGAEERAHLALSAEGYSAKEIAAMHGTSAGAVDQKLSRARRRVRAEAATR